MNNHDENHEFWFAFEKHFENDYNEHVYHNSNRRSNSSFDNDDEIRFFFIIARKTHFICHRCNEKFIFNNKFHYHVRRCKYKSIKSITNEVFCNLIATDKFKIIRSFAIFNAVFDFDFRSWKYAKLKTNINFKNSNQLNDIYFDIDVESFFDDRKFIIKRISNYVDRIVRKSKVLKINDIEFIAIIINECISIDFFISNEINDKSITTCFTRYVYFVDDLKTNILFDNDILKSKNIVSHVKKKFIINNCEDFSVSFNVITKNNIRIKRIIRV